MSGYIGNIPVPQATQTRDVFTATSGQTTFATSGYTPGFLDVWLNGVKLVDGTDFTATNGSDVVLTSGAAASDIVEVLSYSTFEVNSQTFTGTTTLSGDLQATTATFSGAVTGTDLTLSGGVYLGGTGAANYLDDYEEGTWTPTALGTTTDPAVTYDGSTAGRYTKVGNHVNFWFYIKLTSVSGGSGDLNIGGLPFTNVNQGAVSDGHATSINYYLNTNLASGRIPTGYTMAANNKIYIVVSGAGTNTALYSVTSMSNGFVLYGSGTLSVA